MQIVIYKEKKKNLIAVNNLIHNKSRFTAIAGRNYHILKCKNDWDVRQEYIKFKEFLQAN